MTVHFVAFRGEEVNAARRIWGAPDFWHRCWDARAKCEVADGDIVIFATGTANDPVNPWTFNDSQVF